MACYTDFDIECDVPFDRKIQARESKVSLGPFRATQLWHEIVDHLRRHIVCKRRRYRMRYYDNCFTGVDAVDVILHYLLEDRENFSPEISREKAVKLCQVLVDRQVIKCVGTRLTECTRAHAFEDSNNKLYQFKDDSRPGDADADGVDGADGAETASNEDNDMSVDEGAKDEGLSETESGESSPHAEEMRMQADMEPDFGGGNDSLIYNPINLDTDSPIIDAVRMLRGSVRHKSIAAIRNSFNDKKLVRQFSFREKEPIIKDVQPEVSDDVWKEVALSKLLTLIELPILDGLLSDDKQSKKSSRYHASHAPGLKRCGSNESLGSRYTHDDIWMQTALDVLERLPSCGVELDRYCSLRPTVALKRQIFYIIVDHYRTTDERILPERFTDLHLRILKLIMQEKHPQAVQALQLHMILLSWQRTEELNRLLMFMVAVSNYLNCRLHPVDDNNCIVLNSFTDVILKNSLISHDLAKLFVGFLMVNIDTIFTIPDELHERVNRYLDQLSRGDFAVIHEDYGFCSRVSAEEYLAQTKECTDEALREIMTLTLQDATIPVRERRQRLKIFQKVHPDLYEKYFSEEKV